MLTRRPSKLFSVSWETVTSGNFAFFQTKRAMTKRFYFLPISFLVTLFGALFPLQKLLGPQAHPWGYTKGVLKCTASLRIITSPREKRKPENKLAQKRKKRRWKVEKRERDGGSKKRQEGSWKNWRMNLLSILIRGCFAVRKTFHTWLEKSKSEQSGI